MLGLDPVTERDLLYIAKEGIKAPLPTNWKPVYVVLVCNSYNFIVIPYSGKGAKFNGIAREPSEEIFSMPRNHTHHKLLHVKIPVRGSFSQF